VRPIGPHNTSPKPGPGVVVVTHGLKVPTNELLAKLSGGRFGAEYDGQVAVPNDLSPDGEVSGSALQSIYGEDNTFYCNKNGAGAVYPHQVASEIVNINLTPQDRERQEQIAGNWIDSLSTDAAPH